MSKLPVAEWLESRRGTATAATLTGTTRLRYTTGDVAAGQVRVLTPTLALDPGGAARVVYLPPASQVLAGVRLSIVNTADAAEALNIVDDTVSVSAVSLAAIAQDETGEVICTNGGPGGWRWYNLGVGGAT
jgi:hypothetical protein